MKKKHKIIKTFSFTSLALLMGIAGTMAFAPLGASPSVAGASEMVETTTEQGLITPKADDPVIYTTESGLNIKFGNAINGLSAAGGGNETSAFDNYNPLSSGNLSGFAYFTTTDGTNTYTWVIIGQNLTNPSNLPITKEIDYQKLSYWQANKAKTETYKNFFDNTYEATTPAGLAIKNNNLLNDYAALRIPAYSMAITMAKYKTEIPSGCVLVLANDIVTSGVYNTSYKSYSSYKSATYKSSENIQNAMEGYYTNSSWGISTIKDKIQTITTLTTYVTDYRNSWGTRGDTIANRHIFPLAAYSSSTFYWANYLTGAQIKLSSAQWLRGNHGDGWSYDSNDRGSGTIIKANATAISYANISTSSGYRPAFCLKIS